MIEVNNHTIARVLWKSSFDEEREVGKLQGAISSWSNIFLPREANAIFDKICPNNQTWTIPYLEIDLGPISQDDLKTDLAPQFAKAMYDALETLIREKKNDKKCFRIQHQKVTDIEIFKSFLTKGYFPWNFSAHSKSLDQLIFELLEESPKETVHMLREIGQKEVVRKRLAFQLSALNRKLILRALEPNDHEFIIEFVTTLNLVQKKTNLVNDDQRRFKEHVWYWVFNYLLLDRGTLFNKIAFATLNLQQLASHYNIDYQLLLDEITKVIKVLVARTDKQTEFVNLLKVVSQVSNTKLSTSHPKVKDGEDLWVTVEEMLKTTSPSGKSVYFSLSRLIVKLYAEDAIRFAEVLQNVVLNSTDWNQILDKLDEPATETMLLALCGNESVLIDWIRKFQSAVTKTKLSLPAGFIWEETILVVLHKRNTIDRTRLIVHLLAAIQNKVGNSAVWMDLFIASEEIVNSTNATHIQYTEELQNILGTKLSKSSKKESNKTITKLIVTLIQMMGLGQESTETFRRLDREFSVWIQKKPTELFIGLRSIADVEAVVKLVPLLMDRFQLKTVLEHNAPKQAKISEQFIKTIKALSAKVTASENFGLTEIDMLLISLNILVRYGDLSETQFLNILLKQIANSISSANSKSFSRCLSILQEDPLITSHGIPATTFLEIREMVSSIKINPLVASETNIKLDTSILIDNKAVEKETIIRILRNRYLHKEELSIRLEVSMDSVIKSTLKYAPETIRALIKEFSAEDILVKDLAQTVGIETFCIHIASDLPHAVRETMESSNILWFLLNRLYKGDLSEAIKNTFWKMLLTLVHLDNKHDRSLNKLTQYTIETLKQRGVGANYIISTLKEHKLFVPSILRANLCAIDNQFVVIHETANKFIATEELKDFGRKDNLESVCYKAITFNTRYQVGQSVYSAHEIIEHVFRQNPTVILKVIGKKEPPLARIISLQETLSIEVLCNTLKRLFVSKSHAIENSFAVYLAFGQLGNKKMASRMRDKVYSSLLLAAAKQSWTLLVSDQLLTTIISETVSEMAISAKKVLSEVKTVQHLLPFIYQTFMQELEHNDSDSESTPSNEMQTDNIFWNNEQIEPELIEGVTVSNAGVVMLASYIELLFERLHLTEAKQFTTESAQLDAVHYLQYLVTGKTQTEEHFLVLNKILCGMSPSQPVAEGIFISQEETNLIEGLVEAVIGHWPAIGDSSVEGFRGNWLVRDAVLVETPERWELTVEKRAYDLLINQSPFSFSIIRFPWMKKPLHVIWPY